MMYNRSIFLAIAAVLACVSRGAGQGTRSATLEVGQQLVQQSARNVFNLAGLDAEFHFRTQAYDQSLVGSGKYLQSGTGPYKLFRLELSTSLEEGKATQQTICGKQYLWIRRSFRAEQTSLARVSLRRLRQAIEDSGPPLTLDSSPIWLGIVSLPKMMDSIGGWFAFGPAEEARIGDRNVLRLHGTINAELRDKLLVSKKGQGREQIPDAIELTLGTDQALPLFPYRIEYLKAIKGKTQESFSPLLTLDFSKATVLNDIDPDNFEYAPGDQEVEDRTRLFLERLGLKVAGER